MATSTTERTLETTDITLRLATTGKGSRAAQPVRLGIPFARGVLETPGAVGIVDASGHAVPSETAILARWPDGSARWALVEFLATAPSGDYEYGVVVDQDTDDGGAEVAMRANRLDGAWRIDTGSTSFVVGATTLDPLSEVFVGDATRSLVERCEMVLTDGDGVRHRARVDSLGPERVGVVRSTFQALGAFEANGVDFCRFEARLDFWSQSGLVDFDFTLHNPRAATHPGGLWDLGDPGSVLFREMALELVLADGADWRTSWSAAPEDAPRDLAGGDLEIYQDSSGGENWNSRHHVDRDGRPTVRFRGARIRCGETTETRDRVSPTLHVDSKLGAVSVGVPRFWQEFPKSLELLEGRTVRVGLFPRQHEGLFELQGGEKKTHRVTLEFARSRDEAGGLEWTHSPLKASLPPAYYEAAGAFPYLVADAKQHDNDWNALIANCIEGPHRLVAKREVIDEYGWRNFGDLWADHESAYYKGPEPVVSHYNNQYDGIWGLLYQFARTGDTRWLEPAHDLAQHVVDIDIYHTSEDRPAYSGGLFWHTDHYTDVGRSTHRTYSADSPQAESGNPYGGGPSCEHCYTTGLLYWHWMTGDPRGRRAVLGLADWVLRIDDGSRNVLGAIDDGPTGLASATYSPDYHGPGRGAGNPINALVDAWELSRDRKYLDKAEELIRRCVHPGDDPAAHGLHDAESRWSYLLFFQVLGKYLDAKLLNDEIDDAFAYARASLVRYAIWMAEHEAPYKERLDSVEYPTETWSAHDLRKSCVFDFAARYGPTEWRDRFLERAEFFYREGLEGLLSFDTCTFTRPLVIAMTCGAQRTQFRSEPPEIDVPWDGGRDFGSPAEFAPQKARVKRALRTPRGLAKLALALLRPSILMRILRGRIS